MTVSPPLVDADATRAWGRRLGRMLRAGDLVILTGGLGTGKTTLTQGIAEGLGVRGPITSPTFVISRVHPSVSGGPVLVHVDAYRLGGLAELDDLDLDTDLDRAVTVVEWGHGLAEDLATDGLEVTLEGESVRTATVTAWGERWATAEAQEGLGGLGAPLDGSLDGSVDGPVDAESGSTAGVAVDAEGDTTAGEVGS